MTQKKPSVKQRLQMRTGSNSVGESKLGPRVKYVLYCKDFFVASKYAAEHDWHLSWWVHLGDDWAPDEVVCFERVYVE
jgi:hypothetical protein